jgi:hypothetical protein
MDNSSQETKLTREQILIFRKRLDSVISSKERDIEKLQELSARPSFMKLKSEKLQRHFRRLNAIQKQLEEARGLAQQIDLELVK